MNQRLAVVLGGWHYPYVYYKQMKEQKVPDGWEIDYYVVSHRDNAIHPILLLIFDS
jgi:hypothetical protein